MLAQLLRHAHKNRSTTPNKETKMSSRPVKLSTKFNDCVTSAEIDNLFDVDPQEHVQLDSRTNNITFNTGEHTNTWKKVTLAYFGDKSEIIKTNNVVEVMRIKFQESSKEYIAKINLYTPGSVTIQGAKCKEFEKLYFKTLKELVHEEILNPNKDDDRTRGLINDSMINKTQDESNPFDTSNTSQKTMIQMTSTPVNTNKRQTLKPEIEGRIQNRKETINTKLDSIFDVIGQTLSKLVDLVTDVK